MKSHDRSRRRSWVAPANNDARSMSRRQVLSTAFAAGAFYASGALPGLTGQASAAGFAAVNRRILAHISLNGGPDMRHLFPPPFTYGTSSYGRAHWEGRASVHEIANSTSAMRERWNKGYFHVRDAATGTRFGILKRCGWLKRMWDQGNVALLCNVYGSGTRAHDRAIRTMEMGNMGAGLLTRGNGWGGRLAQAAGGNVVSLTRSPRNFCFGPDPAAPRDLSRIDNARLVPASNTRNIGLFDEDPDAWIGPREHVVRALRTYYAGKRGDIPKSSVYHQFMEHERKLREIGKIIGGRLDSVPVPSGIEALFGRESPQAGYLAGQMRGVYDALAVNDLLNLRVLSLEYNGWDTHDNQRKEMEPRLQALFSLNGYLHSLYKHLPAHAKSKLVWVITGEFGRQLKGNGTRGTDHGVGNTVLVIGQPVNGGVYGEMFPREELERIDSASPDITGLTGIDHAFGRVCNWVKAGSRASVFPDAAAAPLESGAGLRNLFG
ncbi:MAG: DUF1501 domain-containing protein [Gammaproteobacteria bacterium]